MIYASIIKTLSNRMLSSANCVKENMTGAVVVEVKLSRMSRCNKKTKQIITAPQIG